MCLRQVFEATRECHLTPTTLGGRFNSDIALDAEY